MARTPSMTPQEAESILGPRGNLTVNSNNRATVRKWLVAQGFPALFAAGLSMREMQFAYNDADGRSLAALRRKLAEAQENGIADAPEAQEALPAAPIAPIPFEAQNAPAAAPAPANAIPAQADPQDPAALLRELLLKGYTPGLDESRVRSLIKETLTETALTPKTHVIEIRHDDKPPIKIEGRVHPDFERVLNYLRRGLNVMLVGPAGCGKSHMAKQLATALAVDFGMICGSAGATESEFKGWLLPVAGGAFEYCPSQFVRLFEKGDALFCLDEMDGFDSNMLMCVNVPLANGHIYVQQRRENPVVVRGPNFFFLATANTYGTGANPIYCGRNPLDEATRDRFVIVTVDYDNELESQIGAQGGLSQAEMAGIWELRERCREAGLRRVISTRAFQKAAAMKASGDNWRQIRDRLLEGWTADEKQQVGV